MVYHVPCSAVLPLTTALLWGLAPPDASGAAMVLAGLALASRSLAGRPARDAVTGGGVGLAFALVFLSWTPGIWVSAGGTGGYEVWLACGLASGVAGAVWWALASWAMRSGWSAATALALASAATVELALALLPLPLHPPLLVAATPVLLVPARVAGHAGLCLVVCLLGAHLPDRRAIVGLAAVAALGAFPHADGPVAVRLLLNDVDAFDGNRSSTVDRRAQQFVPMLELDQVRFNLTPETAWPLDALPTPRVPAIVGHRREGQNRLTVVGDGTSDSFAKRLLVPQLEDDFAAGDGPRRLRVAGLEVLPLICYEDFFPSALREGHDPDLVVSATNDAWTTDTPGNGWHLAASRLAAATTGRWVLRAANGGTSGAIDPAGHLHGALIPSVGSGRSKVQQVAVRHPTWTGLQGSLPLALVAGLLLWRGPASRRKDPASEISPR